MHIVAGGIQDIGDRVAQNQIPAEPHVQWTGGIGAAVLYLHPLAFSQIGRAIGIASLKDLLHLLGQPPTVQRDVDKARRCHAGLFDERRGLHAVHDAPADFHGTQGGLFGFFEGAVDVGDHLERQASRIVAMLRPPGALHDHLGDINFGQAPLLL